MNEQQNTPFKIKLHPLLDEKTLNAISDATLEAIGDQLYKPPALTPDDIGKNIEGEGIYIGTYAPVDRDGVSLKKVFNVFAAPGDLPGGMRTYHDTVTEVASLKNWHGHDGTNYANDVAIYNALRNGRYKGGWIIPPLEILSDKDINGNKTNFNNVFSLAQSDQSFKKTFSEDAGFQIWLWSSTEYNPYSSVCIRLSDGAADWNNKNNSINHCRPVRLVPV